MRIEHAQQEVKGVLVLRVRGHVLHGLGDLRAHVEVASNGRIRLWDRLSMSWTTDHDISETDQERIRKATL